MADVLIEWQNRLGVGDITTAGADLGIDPTGLETAVLMSLFTDRRANEDDLPPGEFDRRGWWGDALSDVGDEIGSHLWLLGREKQLPSVLVRAEGYANEALAWMLSDGIVREIQVMAEWVSDGFLGIRVEITLPDRSAAEFQFSIEVPSAL